MYVKSVILKMSEGPIKKMPERVWIREMSWSRKRTMDLIYRTEITDLHTGNKLHLLPRVEHRLKMDYFVKHLIAAGNDINARDHEGRTPLEKALIKKSLRLAEALIDAGARRDSYGYPLKKGPLHIAALFGYLDILLKLLGKGANLEAVDNLGNTALHYGSMSIRAQFDKTKVMELLLDAGANVHARNNNGFTPLHYAHGQVVPLLSNGADASALTSEGQTPLHRVFADHDNYSISFHVVNKLIDAGCEVDRQDDHGRSALHYAMWHFDEKILLFLLEKGATVDLLDREGLDPFCYGLKGASTDRDRWRKAGLVSDEKVMKCMEILFKHGARINRDDRSTSPLYVVLGAIPKLEIVNFFLTRGATFSIDDQVISGFVRYGPDEDIRKLLLKFAAMFNMKGKKDDDVWTKTDFDEKISKFGNHQYNYYAGCRNELNVMKFMRIEGTEITYFEVLVQKYVARHVKDRHVVAAFKNKGDICVLFPIYGEYLYDCFVENKKKQAFEAEVLSGLGHIFGWNQHSFAVVFDHILCYLNEEEKIQLTLV